MSRLRPLARSVAAVVFGAAAFAACAEPPTREINQAQGALDAARAAGAETYAKSEFEAADAALKRAHTAVGERDYRQALGHALDARERARTAAREAAAARARAATLVANEIQATARNIETLRGRATGPGSTREQRARFTPILERLTADLQEARSAVAAGDYTKAQERTRAVGERIATLSAELRPKR